MEDTGIKPQVTEENEETSALLEYDIVNLDRDIQQELWDSVEKEECSMKNRSAMLF